MTRSRVTMLSIKVIAHSPVPQSAPCKAANRPASSSNRSPCYAPNQIYKDKQSNFFEYLGHRSPRSQTRPLKVDRSSDLQQLVVVHVAAGPVCEPATVAVFESATSLTTRAAFHATSTSTHGTSTRVEASTKALWTDAALLDKDALTTNFVRVCADCGLVGGWGGKVGKRAILEALSVNPRMIVICCVVPSDG